MAKDKKKVNASEDKNKKHFWKDYRAELKKVKWPTAKELFNSTAAVLAIVFIVADIVIILDLAFESLNRLEVNGIEKLQNSIVIEENSDNTVTSDENELVENAITENELNAAENTVE